METAKVGACNGRHRKEAVRNSPVGFFVPAKPQQNGWASFLRPARKIGAATESLALSLSLGVDCLQPSHEDAALSVHLSSLRQNDIEASPSSTDNPFHSGWYLSQGYVQCRAVGGIIPNKRLGLNMLNKELYV